jgi:hypothetical protein
MQHSSTSMFGSKLEKSSRLERAELEPNYKLALKLSSAWARLEFSPSSSLNREARSSSARWQPYRGDQSCDSCLCIALSLHSFASRNSAAFPHLPKSCKLVLVYIHLTFIHLLMWTEYKISFSVFQPNYAIVKYSNLSSWSPCMVKLVSPSNIVDADVL